MDQVDRNRARGHAHQPQLQALGGVRVEIALLQQATVEPVQSAVGTHLKAFKQAEVQVKGPVVNVHHPNAAHLGGALQTRLESGQGNQFQQASNAALPLA